MNLEFFYVARGGQEKRSGCSRFLFCPASLSPMMMNNNLDVYVLVGMLYT